MDKTHHHYRPQQGCEGYVFTCVCHSVHGGVCYPSRWYPSMPCSRGEGGACSGGLWRPGPRKQTATVADGTHPTGMHSCSKILLQKLLQLKENRSAENT